MPRAPRARNPNPNIASVEDLLHDSIKQPKLMLVNRRGQRQLFRIASTSFQVEVGRGYIDGRVSLHLSHDSPPHPHFKLTLEFPRLDNNNNTQVRHRLFDLRRSLRTRGDLVYDEEIDGDDREPPNPFSYYATLSHDPDDESQEQFSAGIDFDIAFNQPGFTIITPRQVADQRWRTIYSMSRARTQLARRKLAAAERAYAPGGAGFKTAMSSFAKHANTQRI